MGTKNPALFTGWRKPLNNYFFHSLKTRVAMSLLEVFLALTVLATGILGSMSVMTTVNDYRRNSDEISRSFIAIDDLAQQLRSSLGSSILPWQEHRRATILTGDPASTIIGHKETDLVTAGALAVPTGLADAEYYFEYYSDQLLNVITDRAKASPSIDPKQLWISAVGYPGLKSPDLTVSAGGSTTSIYAYSPSVFLPRDKLDLGALLASPTAKPISVVIRILVSWRPSNGGDNAKMWNEIVVGFRP